MLFVLNERFISVGRGVNVRSGISAARNLMPLGCERRRRSGNGCRRWRRSASVGSADSRRILLPGGCGAGVTTTASPCQHPLYDNDIILYNRKIRDAADSLHRSLTQRCSVPGTTFHYNVHSIRHPFFVKSSPQLFFVLAYLLKGSSRRVKSHAT